MALLCEMTVNATVRRIAYGARALTDYQWRPRVISFEPVRYSMEQRYGGYVSVEFGQMEVSPEVFSEAADWPPPVKCALTVKYLDLNESTDEGDAVVVFTGTAHLAGVQRDGIKYRLYHPEFDVNLLDEDTDYNGDVVPLPRAFGAVTHVNLVRLPDVGGKPTYHKGYVTGVLGTNYHIFDDGVDIDANATDNGASFSLNVALVGELTLSGTGANSTVSTIFDWACGASYLNLTYDDTYKADPSPGVIRWADSQQTMTSFLSDLSAFFSHIYYVSGTTLYLIGMAKDNGSRALGDYGFFKGGGYFYEVPVSMALSDWNTRSAVEETIGKYIKTYDHETFVESSYPYGGEMRVTPFHNVQSNIDTALEDILDTIHAPWCRIAIPLSDDLPSPGEKITVTDTALNQDTTIVFRVRGMSMDFDNKSITIEGEGSVS